MTAESLESRLRRVQEDFIQTLPARILEFRDAWDADLPVIDLLKHAHHLAHRLSGGAGTLGQPDLSTAAKVLELEIQAVIESGQTPDAATLARFRQRAGELVNSIRALP